MTGVFIYTGPNPWHETDIMEILGSEPKTLRVNYFTDGIPHQTYISLPFDASQDFHNYKVIWMPDYIEWYVDGVQVYRATTDLPSIPGRFMINLWPGDSQSSGWMGSYSGQPTSVFAKNPSFIGS